jgi:hypothetical protein
LFPTRSKSPDLEIVASILSPARDAGVRARLLA